MRRMKIAKFSILDEIVVVTPDSSGDGVDVGSGPVMAAIWFPVRDSVTSSGNWLTLVQLGKFPYVLSVGNISLVTPISTLEPSAENVSKDLICAFHPKRVMV